MRIALIPSAFVPSVGGVEEVTRELALELSRTHAVEVWTSSASGPREPECGEVDGLAVRRFDFFLPPGRLTSLARFPLRARRTLTALSSAYREFQPQVLHVICFSANGAYATELGRRHGTPLVLTLAGETFMDDHDIYDNSVLLRAALRRGIRAASAVTACSRYALDDARRFGLPAGKGSVIFNGTTPEEIPPVPLETGFERYVLCLGRVVAKKGFDLMIAAFTTIAKELPHVGLVIAGGGTELPALRALADGLGLGDRVQFTGPLDRARVAGAIEGASALVMPSRVEPFGIVALEGWRGGTPVVVSSRGGASEFVRHELDGLVVDPFDTAALAQSVLRVLEDDELAEALVASGRERLGQFTWSHIARQYLETYQASLD